MASGFVLYMIFEPFTSSTVVKAEVVVFALVFDIKRKSSLYKYTVQRELYWFVHCFAHFAFRVLLHRVDMPAQLHDTGFRTSSL